MKKLYFSILLIFASGLGAAFLALPGDNERVTMLVRDHYTVEAFKKLKTMYRNGGREPANVKKLIQLYIRYGQGKEIGPVIDDYLEKNPDDEVVNDFRLWLYELKGKRRVYLHYLEDLTSRTHSKKYFGKLVGKYRLDGKPDQEIRLMEEYRHHNVLEARDFRRLGAIYADRNKPEKALSAFREMDKREEATGPGFSAARLTMFRILLENSHGAEAVRRSYKWIDKRPEDGLILGLMREFDKYGRIDLALEFGTRSMSVMPGRIFTVVKFLNDKKQYSLSRILLHQWKSSVVTPGPGQMEQYIRASINADDTAAVVELFSSRKIRTLSPAIVLVLAREFLAGEQYFLLSRIRPFLSYELMKKKPLMSARIALLSGEHGLALRLLGGVTPAMLERHEYGSWIRTMVRLRGETATFDSLKDLYGKHKIPKHFLAFYKKLARKLGKKQEYRKVTLELEKALPQWTKQFRATDINRYQ